MNLMDFFEADVKIMPVDSDKTKDYAIYVNDNPVVKFATKFQALATFNELQRNFPEATVEIRPVAKIKESATTVNTARALAQELYTDLHDLYQIKQAGSRTGAGHPDYTVKLAASVRELAAELDKLGYEFDLNSPGYIRPLTIDQQPDNPRISEARCVECGGPSFSDLLLAEKKDACYHKVRSRYKVWPSAYASGALVQCRKKGAANWGNKG